MNAVPFLRAKQQEYLGDVVFIAAAVKPQVWVCGVCLTPYLTEPDAQRCCTPKITREPI
jgi:hypothetical protein